MADDVTPFHLSVSVSCKDVKPQLCCSFHSFPASLSGGGVSPRLTEQLVNIHCVSDVTGVKVL